MAVKALLGLLWLLGACGPVEQPESLKTVAAIEIPLRTPADRADLLAMLRRHAVSNGMHVDDGSEETAALQRTDPNFPDFARRSLDVGVWRGANDDDMEVSADDAGHPGRAWLTFAQGTQVEAATRMREGLLQDLRRRWPNAQPLPVLPWGGLPLSGDMVLTPSGYRIKRSQAAGYNLPADSALLAPE